MSWDLEIWTAGTPDIRAGLATPERWTRYSDTSWAYESAEWQIVIGDEGPTQDYGPPPPEVTALLPAAANFTLVSLEPIGAPEDAYRLLIETAVRLATSSGGVCYDSANGEVIRDVS